MKTAAMQTLVPTNHLIGEADEAMLALVMGDYFHNSQRCDLPTRRMRIYFAPFDEVEVNAGAEDRLHQVNLKGFDSPMARGTDQGWKRFTVQYLKGYQVRDLNSFTWRAQQRGNLHEIVAERISESRWKVEYRSNCVIDERYPMMMVEYESLLVDYLRMIDPETFDVVRGATLASLASAAARASQVNFGGLEWGTHPQMYRKIQSLADQNGIKVGGGMWRVSSGVKFKKAQVKKWWKMMLALPIEEDEPTFREDKLIEGNGYTNVVLDWQLRHVDILVAKHGSGVAQAFNMTSKSYTEQEMIDILITIGEGVEKALGHPPTFSFMDILHGRNWKPCHLDDTRIGRILAAVSAKLGWTMR